MRKRNERSARQWGRGLFFVGVLGLLTAQCHAQSDTSDVAAVVNDEKITISDFYARLQIMRAQDFIVSVSPLQVRSEFAGTVILDALINERLILQWAAKTKDLPPEADITSNLATLEAQPFVQQALTSHLVTEDVLRRDVQAQLARFNIATAALSITPAELDAYYKKNEARYGTPERVTLAIIRTSKRTNLPKIEDQLRAGKPFREVAKAFSDDPTVKEKGGEIGPLNASDPKLPEALREAVRKLKAGDVSPAVRVKFLQGNIWFFVRLTSRVPAQIPTLDSIRRQVERQALLERAGGFTDADKKISEFRQSAKIVIALPGYESLLPKNAKKP